MNGNIGQMGAATIAAYVITSLLYILQLYSSKCNRNINGSILCQLCFKLCSSDVNRNACAIFTFPLMIMVILFLQHRDQKCFYLKD